MPRKRTYGLDVDTIAYAARVKVGVGVDILPENLKQINKFVVGVKKLGIWQNIICWPMRSVHNAGKGSTVYSLGGLGTFNGVLTNQVSWGNEGLFWSVTNSYMQIDNLKLSNVPCSFLVVDSARTPGYITNGYFNHSNGKSVYFPGGNNEYLAFSSPTSQQLNFGSSINIATKFKMVSMTVDSNTTAKGYYNTTFKSATNANFIWDNLSVANALRYSYSTNVSTPQTWSMPLLMHSNINFVPYYLNFYNLFRTTIGKNLDLPY